MSKQYDYSKKTEEVMFTVISKVGDGDWFEVARRDGHDGAI